LFQLNPEEKIMINKPQTPKSKDAEDTQEDHTRNYGPGTGSDRSKQAAHPGQPTDPSKIPDPNASPEEQMNELNERAPGLGTLEDEANKGRLK
jgi:hypothetical protein